LPAVVVAQALRLQAFQQGRSLSFAKPVGFDKAGAAGLFPGRRGWRRGWVFIFRGKGRREIGSNPVGFHPLDEMGRCRGHFDYLVMTSSEIGKLSNQQAK
jgi:hypothetical protein